MDRVRYLSLFKESPLLTLTMQHRAIFDAIKAHDPDAARSAVRKHLEELNFSIASISTRNSEWFED
ncbi:putative HTH-type transcriptional regulator YdfH [compost metagenome]